MKPLPAEGSLIDRRPAGTSVLPSTLPQTGGPRPKSNRRIGTSPGQRAYPFLLVASTAVAAFFCYLYLTKPVIMTAPVISSGGSPGPSPLDASAMLAAGAPTDRLPGEPAAARPVIAKTKAPLPLKSTGDAPFEETNLQVQNVAIAEAPGGISKRLDVKIPVVYRSRNLRWTKDEVATARDLLARLKTYQEKTHDLHEEGVALASAWNHLIDRSIPPVGLQADSPTLPSNQPGLGAPVTPVDTIHLQPAGK